MHEQRAFGRLNGVQTADLFLFAQNESKYDYDHQYRGARWERLAPLLNGALPLTQRRLTALVFLQHLRFSAVAVNEPSGVAERVGLCPKYIPTVGGKDIGEIQIWKLACLILFHHIIALERVIGYDHRFRMNGVPKAVLFFHRRLFH